MHCVGYVAPTSQEAANEFYPGYATIIDSIGRERGWPPSSRAQFDAQLGPRGAFLVGSPEQVADKIARHSEALGGISASFLEAQPWPYDDLSPMFCQNRIHRINRDCPRGQQRRRTPVYATGVKAMSNNSVRPAASSANVSLACALFGDSMTVASCELRSWMALTSLLCATTRSSP